MTDASHYLYDFISSTVRGLCSIQDEIHIEVLESFPLLTTMVISCAEEDLKFVYARAQEIRSIAISIASRHKRIVKISMPEAP